VKSKDATARCPRCSGTDLSVTKINSAIRRVRCLHCRESWDLVASDMDNGLDEIRSGLVILDDPFDD